MAENEPRRRTIMLVGDTESFTPYGLNDEDLMKVSKVTGLFEYQIPGEKIDASPIEAINALGDLGYHVISTTYMSKSDKLVWMLERNIKKLESPEVKPPTTNYSNLSHVIEPFVFNLDMYNPETEF